MSNGTAFQKDHSITEHLSSAKL